MGNNKEALLKLVADYYSLSPEEIKSPKRDKWVSQARHLAMYLLRKDFNLSYPAIGKFLGDRDHTTVIHGYMKIARNMTPDIAGEILWIRNKFAENQKADLQELKIDVSQHATN